MGKLYEEQEDGSLKLVGKTETLPADLVKAVDSYLLMRERGLDRDEIHFVILLMKDLLS